MDRLPDELLCHCFAFLTPRDLRSTLTVCKQWSRIIIDDSSWRLAFQRFYGTLPIRRLATSWREEYTLRTNLLSAWKRGKSTTVTFEPKIGNINRFQVNSVGGGKNLLADQPTSLQIISLEQGTIANCDLTSGRVSRDVVYLGDGQSPQPVGCVRLVDNSRAWVGHLNGTLSRVDGLREGGSAVQRLTREQAHLAPVTCLQIIPGRDGSDYLVASGSADSTVKLWAVADPSTNGSPEDWLRCLAVIELRAACTGLFIDDEAGHLLATGQDNCVYVWPGCLAELNTGPRPAALMALQPPHRIQLRHPVNAAAAAAALKLSKFIYEPDLQLLLLPAGPDILLFHLGTARLVGQLSDRGQQSGLISAVSCLTLDDLNCVAANRSTSTTAGKQPLGCLAGYESGDLLIWDLSLIFNISIVGETAADAIVIDTPLRRLAAAHQSPISHIVVDAFKICTAGEDGYIRAWDALTLVGLKTLSSRFFRHQDAAARRSQPQAALVTVDPRWRPTCIYSTLTRVYVAVNNHVKVWNFDPDNRLSSFSSMQSSSASAAASQKRKSNKFRRSSRSFSIGSPKSQFKMDVRRDLKESNQFLDMERQMKFVKEFVPPRAAAAAATINQNNSLLTDEEIMQYALMVSAEEAGVTLYQSPATRQGLLPTNPALPLAPALSVPFVETVQSTSSSLPTSSDSLLQCEKAYPPLSRAHQSLPKSQLSSQLSAAAALHSSSSQSSQSQSQSSQSQSSSLLLSSDKQRIISPSTANNPPFTIPTEDSTTMTDASPITIPNRPPSFPRQSAFSASSSSKPRKMSLSEFMRGDDAETSPGGIAIPQQQSNSYGNRLLSSSAESGSGGGGRSPRTGTSPAPIFGSTSSSVAQRPWLTAGDRGRLLDASSAEDEQAFDDSTTDEDQPYFSNLRDPRGLGDGRSGGGQGSSHSGYRRRYGNQKAGDQNWSSVQVVSRQPSNNHNNDDDDDEHDEDLQYVLELSLLEK